MVSDDDFIEQLVASMTPAEARVALEAEGIDVDASQARFDAFLDLEFAKREERRATVNG